PRPPTPVTYTLSLHDALPISHVGCDPDEVRQRSTGQVGIEFGKRNHLPAAGRVRGDVGVVDERTVLLGVLAGGASQKACRGQPRSEEHTSELQSRFDLVCRLL